MIIYGKKYLEVLKDKDINLLVLTNHQKNYIEEYLEITKPVTVAVNNLELKKDISDIDLNPLNSQFFMEEGFPARRGQGNDSYIFNCKH